MPKRVSTREDATVQLARAFRAFGYEGASLTRLQAATGLKSSSLYNYFPKGKEDMADAALAHIGGKMAAALALLSGPEVPAAKAAAFADALDAFYDHGRSACLLNVLGEGEALELFGAKLKAATVGILRALAALAEEAGLPPAEASARAEDALIAVEGALVVSRALGSTAPFRRVLKALPETLTKL